MGEDGLCSNIVKGHQDTAGYFPSPDFPKLSAWEKKKVIFKFRMMYVSNKNSKPGSLKNVTLNYYLLDREHPQTSRGSMLMSLGIYKFETQI